MEYKERKVGIKTIYEFKPNDNIESFDDYLLQLGVEQTHLLNMKQKKLINVLGPAYESYRRYDNEIKLVPLKKVIGTTRSTAKQSVYENVRTMSIEERAPDRFINCFQYAESSKNFKEFLKSYQTNISPIPMVYISNTDEYFVATDGNHRTITAMLLGAEFLKARIEAVCLKNFEKEKKIKQQSTFFCEYSISKMYKNNMNVSIVFFDNNDEKKEYEVPFFILSNNLYGMEDIIIYLRNCIDNDRKIIEFLDHLPSVLSKLLQNTIFLSNKRIKYYKSKATPSTNWRHEFNLYNID